MEPIATDSEPLVGGAGIRCATREESTDNGAGQKRGDDASHRAAVFGSAAIKILRLSAGLPASRDLVSKSGTVSRVTPRAWAAELGGTKQQ
jgi:hypothetical protein